MNIGISHGVPQSNAKPYGVHMDVSRGFQDNDSAEMRVIFDNPARMGISFNLYTKVATFPRRRVCEHEIYFRVSNKSI